MPPNIDACNSLGKCYGLLADVDLKRVVNCWGSRGGRFITKCRRKMRIE